MKLIFITREGDPLPIADRLKDEGNEVVVGMIEEEDGKVPKAKTAERLSLYDGILEKKPAEEVMSWMKSLSNKDEWFFMADYGDLFPYSERALEMGFTNGIFPTEQGYRLEDDRKAGKAFAQKHYPGLKVAPVHEFKKIDDALQFMEDESDKLFVLKSEGSNAETVVPMTDDAELARKQIAGALRTEKSDYEKGFTLEQKLRNPIELSPVMVFWNGKPLFSLLELENKPLGAGNVGRLTGGCQNLTIQTRLDCPLNKIAFPPIVYQMAMQTPGIGIYDSGLLYDGHDFYFTEWCSQRWGWDGIFSEIAMCSDQKGRGAATRHFDLISKGQNPLRWKFGAAVRLFQTEPSPTDVDCFQSGYAVDWLDEVSDQLYFYCIKQEKIEGSDEKQFVSCGYRKDLAVATGFGDSMEKTVSMAYRAAEGVAMTGLYYRPQFDFRSTAYFASIENRWRFLQTSGLL